jgi:FdhD protein
MKVIDCSSPRRREDTNKFGSYLSDEEPVALFINGRYVSTVLLAPGDIREYVTGFLFTEQYIQKRREIESIRVEKNRASVITTNIFTSPGPKKTILSGCGGAVSYIDPGKLPVLSSNFSVPASILVSSLGHFQTCGLGSKILVLSDRRSMPGMPSGYW